MTLCEVRKLFLPVMDKTENITECEALLQDNPFYQHLSTRILNYPERTR